MLKLRPRHEALRIGGIYFALGLLWIVISDQAVTSSIDDMDLNHRIQTWKGFAFVLVSAALITYLIGKSLRNAAELQSQLRAVADQNLAGLYAIQDGNFVFANERAANMLGYPVEELVRMKVTDVAVPEDHDILQENIRKRLTGEVEELRYRMACVRKNGERIRIEVHGRRADWKGGSAVVGIVLDVTEREATEEEERKAHRLMALGELTGAVAHDFNNLLTAIIAPLDLSLERLGANSAEYQEILEARESARRAVTLTRQLLSFSRRRPFRPRPIELGELISEVSPVLHRLSTGVRIELDLAPDLPAVVVDPADFGRVLLNLASNAVEAVSGRGRIRIRTSLDTGENTPRVVLEVEDSGRGMEESVRRRIFEPFFTTRETGTGLGLSTVHGIVTQAGGEITVDSELGVGSTFRIFLPASSEPAEPLIEGVLGSPENAVGKVGTGIAGGLSQNAAAVPREAGTSEEGGLILLVDDEGPVRLVAMRALERHKYQVLPAGNGAEGLAMLDEHPERIDLAILDIGLPDMDGVTLATKILERRPEIAILFTSGDSDERVLPPLARDRTAGFLEKPFTVQTLLESVKRGIRKGREENSRES